MKPHKLQRQNRVRGIAVGMAAAALVLAGGVCSSATAAQKKAKEAGPKASPKAGLGVLVAPSPGGKGVVVIGVFPGSPAEKAGIEPGDSILSVDGKTTNSPEQLAAQIRSHKPGDKLKIDTWRNKKEQTVNATLAERNAALDQSTTTEEVFESRGYLGVMLDQTNDGEVQVKRVYPDSPAAKAGMHEGDVLRRINGKAISSVDDAVAIIEGLKPNSMTKFSVLSKGTEKTLAVKMGKRKDFEERFFSEMLRKAPHMMKGMRGPDNPTMLQNHRDLQEAMRKMHKDMEIMRREMREFLQRFPQEKKKPKNST